MKFIQGEINKKSDQKIKIDGWFGDETYAGLQKATEENKGISLGVINPVTEPASELVPVTIPEPVPIGTQTSSGGQGGNTIAGIVRGYGKGTFSAGSIPGLALERTRAFQQGRIQPSKPIDYSPLPIPVVEYPGMSSHASGQKLPPGVEYNPATNTTTARNVSGNFDISTPAGNMSFRN